MPSDHTALTSRFNRRTFIKSALMAGTAMALPKAGFAGSPSKSKRPNVLFIPIDDLRPQLGCYGAKAMHTPNIDMIAGAGSVFERAYCQQAVCSPSRTSLMTGLRPDNTGVYDLHTHFRKHIPDAVTIPEYFKQQGYYTQAIGKIFHGPLDDPQSWSVPWNRGGTRTPGLPDFPNEYNYYSEEGIQAVRDRREEYKRTGKKSSLPGFIFGLPYDCADIPDELPGDGCVATAGVNALAKRAEAGNPFFLAVGFRKPHLPFCAPKKYWDMYPEDEIDLDDNPFRPKGAPDIALHEWGELRAYYGVPPTGPLSDDLARKLIRGYYACVSYIDAQVGRLIQALKDNGQWDNTIIALWGDHGFHLGDHGLWCKHTNFETAVHAPLIFRDPRSPGGQRSSGLCEFVDIFPTLCDLADLPIPTNLQGMSLAEAVAQGRSEIKEAAFSQYPRPGNIMGYSMRTNRYRYTTWQQLGNGEQVADELYDEHNDPVEMNNIAPEDKAEVARLAELMNRMSPEVFCERKIPAA